MSLSVPKRRVLAFVEYYLPGFRAGGPMRSVSALVAQLGDEIDFRVVTRDRDEGSAAPYPKVLSGEWLPVGKARVRYLAPREITTRRLVTIVNKVQPDVVYLNSLFAPMTVRLLAARRLGALKGIPILLAPRGELSPGARRLKALKKSIFLRLSHWTRLHDGVVFQASTLGEQGKIASEFPLNEIPRVARNPVNLRATVRTGVKERGSARIVFLGRITRVKNLHLAIEHIRSLKGSIAFDIYGPVIDESYWRECRALLASMPSNIAVSYQGPIAHELVASTLSAHDIFFLPTAGENFGHAIVEAFLAGCPVVISDQTPWRGLEQRAVGWDLKLEDTAAWRRALQTCVDMDADSYARASANCQSFGNSIAAVDTFEENRHLFRSMFEQHAFLTLADG